MPVPISLIQQFDIFSTLPQAEVINLSNEAQMALAKAGKTILDRGLNLQYLSFIVSGQLQVTEYVDSSRPVSISLLGPGDSLGELALADQQPITYSVRTVMDTNLLLIPMAHARRLALTNPFFGQRIHLLLAQMIQRAHLEKAMLSLPNAYHRIFVQINLLIQGSRNTNTFERKKIIPRQQDLANMANTSRETVSRALKMLAEHGVLSKKGHHIEIQNIEFLNRLAKEGPEALFNN